jgi:hypothetical protein
MIGGMMYRPDLKDAMIEGYTEALDECKDIAEKTLDIFLKTAKTIDEEITIQRVVHSIQKQMEEL